MRPASSIGKEESSSSSKASGNAADWTLEADHDGKRVKEETGRGMVALEWSRGKLQDGE